MAGRAVSNSCRPAPIRARVVGADDRREEAEDGGHGCERHRPIAGCAPHRDGHDVAGLVVAHRVDGAEQRVRLDQHAEPRGRRVEPRRGLGEDPLDHRVGDERVGDDLPGLHRIDGRERSHVADATSSSVVVDLFELRGKRVPPRPSPRAGSAAHPRLAGWRARAPPTHPRARSRRRPRPRRPRAPRPLPRRRSDAARSAAFAAAARRRSASLRRAASARRSAAVCLGGSTVGSVAVLGFGGAVDRALGAVRRVTLVVGPESNRSSATRSSAPSSPAANARAPESLVAIWFSREAISDGSGAPGRRAAASTSALTARSAPRASRSPPPPCCAERAVAAASPKRDTSSGCSVATTSRTHSAAL